MTPETRGNVMKTKNSQATESHRVAADAARATLAAAEKALAAVPLTQFTDLAAARTAVDEARAAADAAARELAAAEKGEEERASRDAAQRVKAAAEQEQRERGARRDALDAELRGVEDATQAELLAAAIEIGRIKATAAEAVSAQEARGREAVARFNDLCGMVATSATERGELPPRTRPIADGVFDALVKLHNSSPPPGSSLESALLADVLRCLGLGAPPPRLARFWSTTMQLETLRQSLALYSTRRAELGDCTGLNRDEIAEAERVVASWYPELWSADKAAEAKRLRADLEAARERDYTFIGEEAQARSIAELERRIAAAESSAQGPLQ
jgi:hypothetical protein